MHDAVRGFAAGLHGLGLRRGDKIAIVGANRPRLYWSMAAAQWLGAIPIPVYADSVAEEMAYVLAHAEVVLAVVQDQEQVDKLLSVAEQVPTLGHILYDEPRGLRDYDHSRLHPLTELIAQGQARLKADADLAALIEAALEKRQGGRISASSSTPRARRAAPRA